MMATENFFMWDNKELITIKYTLKKEEMQDQSYFLFLSKNCIQRNGKI